MLAGAAQAMVYSYDGNDASANWNDNVLPTFDGASDVVMSSTEAASAIAPADKTIKSLTFGSNAAGT